MTLRYYYVNGELPYSVPATLANLPTRAEMGEVSFGAVPFEDPAAALTLVGHKALHVTEGECSQPRLFTGYVAQRNIGRSVDQTQFVGADARIHDTTIVDGNAVFGFRMIKGTDGNRPEETWDARKAWLLASNYLAGTSGTLIADTGFCKISTLLMDAADYRDGYPSAVLDDLCDRYGGDVNYYAWWDPAALALSLFLDDEDHVTGDSTLRISNVLADYDGVTTFFPDKPARLQRESDQVWSEVTVRYKNGSAFRTMPSTAATYIRRGTVIDRPYISKASTALLAANRFLQAHSVERDRITCIMRAVPAAQVGLVQAGQRISVKFSEMPGYAAFTWMRVVAVTPVALGDHGDLYDIALELVAFRVPPTAALNARLYWHHSYFYGCQPVTTYGDGSEVVGWEYDGDSPRIGLWSSPTTGAAEFVPYSVSGTSCKWDGIRVLADVPNARIRMVGTFGGDSGGVTTSITVAIRINGTILYSETWTDTVPGLHFASGSFNFDRTGVDLKADDVITVSALMTDWVAFCYFAGLPAESDEDTTLWVTGTSDWDGSDAGVELPPPADGPPTQSTIDPTVTDDADAGYSVGSTWVNTTTHEGFILVDATPGAAVWLSITAPTHIGPVAITGPAAANYMIIASSPTAAAWGPHPVHAHSGLSGLTTGDDHTQYLPRIEVRRGTDRVAGITPTGYSTSGQTWSNLANATDGSLATAAVLSAGVLGAGTYYAGFQFDLATPKTLSLVALRVNAGAPITSAAIWGYTARVRYSDDGASWTTLDTRAPIWAVVSANTYQSATAFLSTSARYWEVALVLVQASLGFNSGFSVFDCQWMEDMSDEHALLSDSHRDVDTSTAPIVGDALVWDGTKFAAGAAGGRSFPFFIGGR